MIYTKTLQRGILIFEKKGKTTSNRNSPLTTFTIYASAYNWTVLATALWYHMAPSMHLLPATKQLLLFICTKPPSHAKIPWTETQITLTKIFRFKGAVPKCTLQALLLTYSSCKRKSLLIHVVSLHK